MNIHIHAYNGVHKNLLYKVDNNINFSVRILEMILIFFFVLPLVQSATYDNISIANCPESFRCPAFGPFKYPYYNAADTGCGLIEVNCTLNQERIQFGGQSYEIAVMLDSGPSVLIHNRTLENLVVTESCEALMDNFTSPTPELFSISIEPLVTLFKCSNDPDHAAEIDAYFDKPDYESYKRCTNHSFYYNNPISNTSAPSDLPNRCEVIQLPGTAYQAGNRATNNSNIFSPLISLFSISFPLSPSCDECYNKGGRCSMNQGNFQCFDAKKDEGRKLPRVILLTVCIGAATILLIIILCLKKIIEWRKMANYNVDMEMFLRNQDFLAPKRYSYSQVEKMTNSFKVKLGQGGFGSVYKGVLSNQNQVAVKVLSEVKGDGEDFINEVASVGKTSHVNIVSLVGFCLEGRRRALVYEFMPNGSLERFIYGRSASSTTQLGWEKLHQIAIGIARGLEYLHRDCNTRILHFDIKPHNILLDNDFCPKISDFGLAKLFPEKESKISISHTRGTPGYIAPELFSRNFGEVSHKSDVYSYGMMILEMVGGRRNMEVGVDNTSEIYFPQWIYKKIELHERLGLHGIASDEENRIARTMIIVGLWCIQTNPMNRPTITKVLEMLEGDLEILDIPPKPYLCSPSRSVHSQSTVSLHSSSSFTNTL